MREREREREIKINKIFLTLNNNFSLYDEIKDVQRLNRADFFIKENWGKTPPCME